MSNDYLSGFNEIMVREARRKSEIHLGSQTNIASEFFKCLFAQLNEVYSFIKEDEELGLIVTSMADYIIHIENIGYRNPSLIIFDGFDAHGEKVTLMQHTSQVSLIFKAVKPLENKEPIKKSQIGFITDP